MECLIGVDRFRAAKFGSTEFRQSDGLLALHGRVERMRASSLEALRTCVAYRLVSVNVAAGAIHPLTRTSPRRNVPESVRQLTREGEKVGAWFAQLTPFEVASTLKVRF